MLESVGAVGAALFATFGIVIARLVLRVRWLAFLVTIPFMSLGAVHEMSVMPWSLVFALVVALS
jgi:hypothetical protein